MYIIALVVKCLVAKQSQYSYTDSSVTNGFEYWYSVTAYDRGNEELASLESPRGKTSEATNLVIVTQQSAATG